jgi:hypothetical protein
MTVKIIWEAGRNIFSTSPFLYDVVAYCSLGVSDFLAALGLYLT